MPGLPHERRFAPMRKGVWIVRADSIFSVVRCFVHPGPDVLHDPHVIQGVPFDIGLTGALVLLGCLSGHAHAFATRNR